MIKGGPSEAEVAKVASKLEIKASSDARIGLSLSGDTVSQFVDRKSDTDYTRLRDQFLPDNVIDKVSVYERNRKPYIFFQFNHNRFTENVLQYHAALKPAPPCNKRVVVEFR